MIQHLPRFKRAEDSLAGLAKHEQWSRVQIEEFQLERINQLWKLGSTNCKYYHELKKSRSLPNKFESLQQFTELFPVTGKEAVRQSPECFLSKHAARGHWVRTAGSTGKPMRVYWSKRAHLENLQTRYRWYQQWGVHFLDPQAFLWGHAGSFAPGLKGRMARLKQLTEDRLRQRLRLSAYRLSDDDLAQHARQILRFQPTSMYGYSSAVWLLAKHSSAASLDGDWLKAVFLTGEPTTPKVVDEIEAAFSKPAVAEYGSVECGIIANQDRSRKLRIREDRFFVETVAQDHGHYEILVTVLFNPCFPLLRYRIGDLATQKQHVDATGFATIESVCGRNNDFVVAKSGRLVHSIGVKHIFEQLDHVHRFRVAQRIDGSVKATMEVSDRDRDADFSRVSKQLGDLLEGFPVETSTVPVIAGNLAGKHRWVTSDLFQSVSEKN